ncbi:MAG: MBL fold metallo-hydrolase [Euryarchaeota archaeon]|nr:MBL fold metallo-hydrolase [Euryarchaeota archaeon]
MKLTPLASDSMGARSMAFLVETKDCGILIDPGVRLGEIRYGLPPHGIEIERRAELWGRIEKAAGKADIATISHYHFDHHEPNRPDILWGKRLLVKDPRNNINRSQRQRAADFLKILGGRPSSVETADGKTFEIGKTALTFSGAVPHGTDARLGYVLELAISEGEEVFVHTSDVEGPSLDEQADFIVGQDPSVLACDGPMTYMMHSYGEGALERSVGNLARVIGRTKVKDLILDHHFLRDLKWREKVPGVFEAAEAHGCRVRTFATFAGEEDDLLEARRKALFRECP